MSSRRPPLTSILVNEQGRVVCERCQQALTLGTRMRGLLGRSGLEPGAGLLFPRTSSIHMFFMKFAIDAVFLDREMRVRAISRDLKPWRVAGGLRRGSVLELAAGEAQRVGIEPGMRLTLSSVPQAATAPVTDAVSA